MDESKGKLTILVTGSVPEPNGMIPPYPANEETEDIVLLYLNSLGKICNIHDIDIIINGDTTDRLIIKTLSGIIGDKLHITDSYNFRKDVEEREAFIILVISGESDVIRDYDMFMDLWHADPHLRYGISDTMGFCFSSGRFIEPIDVSFGYGNTDKNREFVDHIFEKFIKKMIKIKVENFDKQRGSFLGRY